MYIYSIAIITYFDISIIPTYATQWKVLSYDIFFIFVLFGKNKPVFFVYVGTDSFNICVLK